MDKPLHVQVAEALGCRALEKLNLPSRTETFWTCECEGDIHGAPMNDGDDRWTSGLVARYDTDWAATGPLIEEYAVDLSWHPRNVPAAAYWTATAWIPIRHGDPSEVKRADGESALVAVCRLILALKATGKLDSTPAARAS